MARPLKEIDEKLVRKLAEIALNPDEIADVMGCSIDDLRPLAGAIYSSWPNDETFKKVRLNRLRKAGAFYSGELKGRVKQAVAMQIADMIVREMGPVESLIGYSIDDLLVDFMAKFKPGMSWENWGEWHIDHIKPRSQFNSKTIRECFALTNLRPLDAKENLRKNKYV